MKEPPKTSSPPRDLLIAPCSIDAARFACEKWHYSHTVPTSPTMRFGVWEHGTFQGVVLFSRGASPQLLNPYGLRITQGCELTRVALGAHSAPVSRIISLAVRELRKACPGLRLIISFADPAQGHHGGIYQAAGWLYLGATAPSEVFIGPDGKQWHGRNIGKTGKVKYGPRYRPSWRRDECRRVKMPGKHRYALPLDEKMRRQLQARALPYPKRAAGTNAGASPSPSGHQSEDAASQASAAHHSPGGPSA